jgi:hypothetical protein
MKKLIGRTDLEDALKRLDKLTHEEARMAIAQVLKATQTVDDRVRAVDDKVAEMMDGARSIFSQSSQKRFDSDVSRRKGIKGGRGPDATFVIF